MNINPMTDYLAEEEYMASLKTQLEEMITGSPVLYKYINYEIGKLALENSSVGFTHPLSFNDPYDCALDLVDFKDLPENYPEFLINLHFSHLDRHQQEVMLLKMKKTPAKLVLDKLKSDGMNAEVKNRAVSCFSKNFNNILMWAHYANAHTGICIGYNAVALYLEIAQQFEERMMVTVDYAKEFKPLNYYRHRRESIIRWLKTKAEIWSYEQEIRIILNHVNFEGSNKYIININPTCVHSVYVGTRMSELNLNELKGIWKDKYPNALFSQIVPFKDRFELTTSPLQI